MFSSDVAREPTGRDGAEETWRDGATRMREVMGEMEEGERAAM